VVVVDVDDIDAPRGRFRDEDRDEEELHEYTCCTSWKRNILMMKVVEG